MTEAADKLRFSDGNKYLLEISLLEIASKTNAKGETTQQISQLSYVTKILKQP
jgi:hypothetical protein